MSRHQRHLLKLLIVAMIMLFIQQFVLKSYKEDELKTVAKHGEQDATVDDVIKEVLSMDMVKRVDDWPHGIKFAIWNNTDFVKVFEDSWLEILDKFIAPGKNLNF